MFKGCYQSEINIVSYSFNRQFILGIFLSEYVNYCRLHAKILKSPMNFTALLQLLTSACVCNTKGKKKIKVLEH